MPIRPALGSLRGSHSGARRVLSGDARDPLPATHPRESPFATIRNAPGRSRVWTSGRLEVRVARGFTL